MKKLYFDNASTTQPFEEVINVLINSFTDTYGNPSSTHTFGRSAKSHIEKVRKDIARQLGAQASEIVFTSGGTEANNLILRACLRDLKIQTIITSAIEHHSVLHTIERLSKEYVFDIQYVNIDEKGNIDLNHLTQMLQEVQNQSVLVSLMHINNEIGNILPIAEVAKICKNYNAYFHSDAVQSIGHFDLNLNEIPVDFITASAHKFHGIKGVGFAYIRKKTGLHSVIFGGEQERGMRAGTEPLHNIIAMGEAFNICYQNIHKNRIYIEELKRYFIENIRKKIPDCVFNGNSSDVHRSSFTIVNVGFPSLKEKGEMLFFNVDLQGVMCSKGSACQSGSAKKSHVLSAFLPQWQQEIPSLRFSFSIFNTKYEIDELIAILCKI